MSKDIFRKTRSGPWRYNEKELELKLKEMLETLSLSSDAPLLETNGCKTFVIAVRHEVLDGPPVRLKSYRLDGSEVRCSILQAARATSAAPTIFPPESIGLTKYVDGGIRYNNPAEEAVREANRIWPSRPIGCLLSIGTGKNVPISGISRVKQQFGSIVGGVLQLAASQTAEKLTVAKYCSELVTGCEEVHRHLLGDQSLKTFSSMDRYYRFNVEYGAVDIEMDEWEKQSTISARTDAYLAEPLVEQKLQSCVLLLTSDQRIRANIG